jgi:phosphoglycolate phosphatase
MHLPLPHAIIFDWDNTLVDTWPVIHQAMVATFSDMGHAPWTLDETKERVRRSMRDAFPELFGDRWEEAGKLYQQHYLSSHLSAIQPLEGAEEVLKTIKLMGLHCVLVSNKKGPTLRKEVANLGWSGYFDNVIGADDAKRDKPHTDPVILAFEKTHIEPSANVWFVGDSDVDLECALNTGCTAILYGPLTASQRENYTHTHFYEKPYHVHVHEHAQTLDLLEAVSESAEWKR